MDNGLLYHYTDSAGLIGIVGEMKLRMTDAAFLNDTEELKHALAEVTAVLRRPSADGAGGVLDGRASEKAARFEGVASYLNRDVLTSTPGARVYVACFCEDGDDLNLWRGYVRTSTGFAIGFDRRLLTAQVDDTAPSPELHPVIYGTSEIRDLLRALDEELRQESAYGEGPLTNDQTLAALRTLARIKHPGFRNEREVRLLLATGGTPGGLQYRPSSGPPIPYLEHQLDSLAIREIRLGPGADERSWIAAWQLAEQIRGVEIKWSGLPYRN